jgi:hypothetical protein
VIKSICSTIVSIFSEKVMFLFQNELSFSTLNEKELDDKNSLGGNGLNLEHVIKFQPRK